MKSYCQLQYLLLFCILIFLCSCEPPQKTTINRVTSLPISFQNIIDSLDRNSSININAKSVFRLMCSLDSIYPKNKFPSVHAISNIYKANYYRMNGQQDSALSVIEKSYLFLNENQTFYKSKYIDLLRTFAIIYRRKNDYTNAYKYANEALLVINKDSSFSKEVRNFSVIGSVYSILGNLYGDDIELDKARFFHKKAIYFLSKTEEKSSRLLAMSYINLGLNFQEKLANHAIDSALYYVNIGVKKANSNDSNTISLGYELLGEFYLAANKTDSSIKYLNKIMTYGRSFSKPREKTTFSQLALAHEKRGNTVLANQFYTLAKNLILGESQTNANFHEDIITKSLLGFAIRNKKFKDSDILLSLYHKENEEAYNQEKAQALKDLEIIYQVKSKDENIQKLKIENDLKTAQLQQSGGVILLFLMTGLIIYFFNRQRLLKQKNESSELEQRFLRSQMNPHFMSNALSAIQAEILEGKSKVANHYLNKYAELTRLIFENSKNKYIPVYNEIKVIENYLLLQKIRFGDRFDYKISLYYDIEHDNIMIPPMLIQPSIENVFEHGFMNIDYKGELNFSIEKQNNFLIAKINDNGKGISLPPITKNKNSFSTSITADRLQMLSKETKLKASINIEPIYPHGVKSTLIIPFIL
jgi:hypothetical protein